MKRLSLVMGNWNFLIKKLKPKGNHTLTKAQTTVFKLSPTVVNSTLQMALPASAFRSAPRLSSESPAPLNSRCRRGIPWRGRNYAFSVHHLSVQKSTAPISASASSPHRCSDGDFGIESPGFGTKGHIHFIGVGGSGLSALAMLALKQVTWLIFTPLSCIQCCI